ncbi:MAG: hypothetical protein JRG86_18920 [Deltaproteobacteria bacterium]|jgi:hypothetical protein|nr:hypothetical protein [Deltaproteobacteria bacterium]MBW2496662.1 hypothetical protein [Deltaproteobacteria bacterium]
MTIRLAARFILLVFALPAVAAGDLPSPEPTPIDSPGLQCERGTTLASGSPDPSIFSPAASRGVRASWCERYDQYGRTMRTGPYRELYPSGAVRTLARLREGRLHGPIEIRHEDGGIWLRSFYVEGIEQGPLEIFHSRGEPWLHAEMKDGKLHGDVRTLYPDGALESETRYERGHEHGLARSFHPARAGGRLHSEVRVDSDRPVGIHRVLDVDGHLRLQLDRDAVPAAPASRSPDATTSPTTGAPPADATTSPTTGAPPADATTFVPRSESMPSD